MNFEKDSSKKNNTIIEYNDIYHINDTKFYYLERQKSPVFEKVFREEIENITIYNISFYSRNFLNNKVKIYGLLFIPKNKTNMPGVVFLPAGGGLKENRKNFGLMLAKQGYSTIIIDQRGVGETGGYYLNPNEDYKIYFEKKEPIQHLSVYDGLICFDILSNIPNIDFNNIIFSGESMGGRYAIIAGAIEKRSKGVFVISSSGFHINKEDKSDAGKYFLSIDPDNYVSDISPNYFIMFQGGNDSVVTPTDANITYNLANDPKIKYFYSNCSHGYCKDMDKDIKESLKIVFRK